MTVHQESAGVLNAPAPPAACQTRPGLHDDRIAFKATWEVYQALVETIGDRGHILLAFDGERVELMSPGYGHEDHADLAHLLVGVVATELRLRHKGAGSTRWRRPAVKRGVEADKSFYFTAEKILAAKANRRSKNELDWPIPDLAFEVDISPSEIDRTGIYAALGVPEVWRFDGETVRIDRLGPDGAYADAPESGFLGIRAVEVRYLLLDVADRAEDDIDFSRLVTEWTRANLLPRREVNGGG
jgi:Uma2 family endonuclease